MWWRSCDFDWLVRLARDTEDRRQFVPIIPINGSHFDSKNNFVQARFLFLIRDGDFTGVIAERDPRHSLRQLRHFGQRGPAGATAEEPRHLEAKGVALLQRFFGPIRRLVDFFT